jgi:hypothetical protein
MKNQVTAQDILAQISLNRKKFDEKGVSYYNKDNKENKDNKDTELELLSLDRATPLEATPLNQVKELLPCQEEGSLDPEAKRERDLEGIEKAETPPRMGLSNPAIVPEEVDRCLLTFYDNGPDARMRYRLAITINPNEAPNERWEFIANLNKDRRIFMRNIPEENKNFVQDFGKVMRQEGKEKYQNYPLIGKIHNNSKRQHSINQKEDGCAAAVQWTGSEWTATVMLWEYLIKDIPLTDSLLTEKQKAQNIRGVSGIIYGPNSKTQAKWQERAKPTFKSKKNGAK